MELLANVNTDASSVMRGCRDDVDGAVGLAGVWGGNRMGVVVVAETGRATWEKEVAAVVWEMVLSGLLE